MNLVIHEKHYKETGLPLMDYIYLLMHEEREPSVKELKEFLCITERTIYRMRRYLVQQGYLETKKFKNKRFSYHLTNKMYG
jgi:Mn-dependent DtxR family transcriptional regulator